MPSRSLALVALLAILASGLAGSLPHAAAQTPRSDLAVVDLVVLNPIYDGAEPAEVIATVRNQGPDDTGQPAGSVHFEYGDRPLTGDSRSDQPFNVTEPLPAGAETTVRVSWSPAEDQIGPGQVSARVDSQWEPSGHAGNNEMTIHVFVEHHNLTTGLVDDEPKPAYPSRTTFHRVLVNNTGNTPANYTFDVVRDGRDEGSGPDPWQLPDGWASSTDPVNATLQPGEERVVLAMVTPADDAFESQTFEPLVNATPEAPLGRSFQVDLPEVRVEGAFPDDFSLDAILGVERASSFVDRDPGLHAVTWTVENNGTHPDVFGFEVNITGPMADHVGAPAPRLAGLNPSETDTLHLDLEVIDPLQVGQWAKLVIEARSINAGEGVPLATSTHRLIASGPNLQVADVQAPDPVYAAANTTLVSVTLANEGNLPSPATNVTVQAKRSGFTAAEATAGVPGIPAGGQAEVRVPFPVADLAGHYAIEALANHPGAFNETNATDNTGTGPLLVRTDGLSVTPAEDLSLEPGGYARFVRPPHLFAVENDGNAPEQVMVTVSTAQGWIREHHNLSLEPGERASVPVEFRVPSLPGVPREKVTVTAHLANRTDVRASDASHVVILDEEPPTLLNASIPRTAEALAPTPVSALFEDAVGVQEAWLVIHAPSGGEQRVTLTETAPGRFNTTLELDQVGDHTVDLHATDRTDANNTYASPEPYNLTSSYDRRPQLGLAEPTSGALRSGDPVRLVVEDEAGIASLNVTVDGQEIELNADKTIDTSQWREGTYTVHIEAVNRFDLSNATDIELTVDNTPPTVADLQADPPSPRPDQAVGFTALVDGDPARVELRIRGTGGESRTLTMDPAGEEGSYQASTELPAGRYTVTAAAIDAAGNEGLIDQPATVEVSADSPAPPILLSLILIVLAVRVGRRGVGP